MSYDIHFIDDLNGVPKRKNAIHTNTRKIVTLCGSTKFKNEFLMVQELLSLSGFIVLSVGLFGHADKKYQSVITPEVKIELDALHRNKILMSDAIIVINPNGYIGESTKNEIEFAQRNSIPIIYLVEIECIRRDKSVDT